MNMFIRNIKVRDFGQMQKGLSLVELLVSMAMGLILMLALLQVVLSSRQAFTLERENAALQENARFAVEMIRREFQRAGDTGCRPEMNVVNFVTGSGAADPQTGDNAPQIRGWEHDEDVNNFPDAYKNIKLANTDSVYVSGIDQVNRFQVTLDTILGLLSRQVVLNPNDPTQTEVNVDSQIDTGDVVLFTSPDCEVATQLSASTVDGASGTLTFTSPLNCATDFGLLVANSSSLSADCSTPLNPLDLLSSSLANYNVSKVIGVRFYIAPSGVDASIPALWRSYTDAGESNFEEQEMVQGVENMQFKYGIDTDSPGDGIPDRYADADDPFFQDGDDWNAVKSVRVSLLLRSLNTVYFDDEANDPFEGFTLDADRYQRQRISFVVYLRNQAALE